MRRSTRHYGSQRELFHHVKHAASLLGLVVLLQIRLGVAQACAAEPFQFRTNDVIAFVGGEDVVEMQRNGYLELLLTAALPHHKLRFRNIAFEGDTVFEQHRQLNFPSWEKQLERVGATVVVAQFGQAESLQGTNGLGKFVEAYDRLISRFGQGGRRILLIGPTPFGKLPGRAVQERPTLHDSLDRYTQAVEEMARKHNNVLPVMRGLLPLRDQEVVHTRDGLHLNAIGHWSVAVRVLFASVESSVAQTVDAHPFGERVQPDSAERLRQLILAKNRLWFDYWRPQNWAFLHGDRTEQQSSRDHRDPKKRWFPEEMEKFLPLIEEKEKEIWKLAANLAATTP